MFHNSQAVLALSKEPNPTVFQKTLGVNDYYFGERRLRVPDGQHPDGGQVAGARCTAARSRIETALAPSFTLEQIAKPRGRFLALHRGSAAAREPGHAGPDGNVHAQLHGQQPGAARQRLYHQLKSHARPPGHASRPSGAAQRLHARTRSRSPVSPTRPAPAGSATIPPTSVLDVNCKAHELDNLYVVDTSFFPSIGAVNPALTAMANALRVGDHLLATAGGGRHDRRHRGVLCGARRTRSRAAARWRPAGSCGSICVRGKRTEHWRVAVKRGAVSRSRGVTKPPTPL